MKVICYLNREVYTVTIDGYHTFHQYGESYNEDSHWITGKSVICLPDSFTVNAQYKNQGKRVAEGRPFENVQTDRSILAIAPEGTVFKQNTTVLPDGTTFDNEFNFNIQYEIYEVANGITSHKVDATSVRSHIYNDHIHIWLQCEALTWPEYGVHIVEIDCYVDKTIFMLDKQVLYDSSNDPYPDRSEFYFRVPGSYGASMSFVKDMVHWTKHPMDSRDPRKYCGGVNLPLLPSSRIPYDATSESYLAQVCNGILQSYILTQAREEFTVDNKICYFACKDAIKQLSRHSVNMYENLATMAEGVMHLPNVIASLCNSSKEFLQAILTKNAKNAYKSIASLYLQDKYVVGNDVQDLIAYQFEYPKIVHSIVADHVMTQHGEYDGLKATVYCYPFMDQQIMLETLGVYPSFSNIWAALPWSFAVDWALHGADNLEEIEFAEAWGSNRYNIKSIWYSQSGDISLDISNPSYITRYGNISFHLSGKANYFRRWHSDVPPEFEYETPVYFEGLEDHFIEGVALFTSFL